MTETRENLTFDSKVELIKGYWENKDRLENLDQLEKEVEAKEAATWMEIKENAKEIFWEYSFCNIDKVKSELLICNTLNIYFQ